MKIFFGIDGGGTKTRIQVENEIGDVLYQGTSSSSGIFAVGAEEASENLGNLVKEALEATGARASDSIYGCIGSAGLGRETERAFFRRFFSEAFPSVHLRLVSDAEILLAGGLGLDPGIVLIAGTGSIAFGRAKDGGIHRAGGFGWRAGDEGSAWWFASEAIRRTLRSAEGRDLPTDMERPLLEHYGFEKREDFITFLNSAEKGIIASGARIVTDAYIDNDPLAADIMIRGVEELSLLVTTLRERLAVSKCPLVLYGGVLEHDETIRRLLIEALAPSDFHIVNPLHTALDGALLLARDPCWR